VKIVIPTYYYQPSNLTPVNRIKSWVDYFTKNGCYVTVITRHWQHGISEYVPISSDLKIERFENHEVHYLPYVGNARTNTKTTLVRKALTLFEQIFQNRNHRLSAYANLFDYTLRYLGENKADMVLISGNPFQLFKIGYLANRKYNQKWIADYRDGWTVGNYDAENQNILAKCINAINSRAERKWLSTASTFTTVSGELQKLISNKINKTGHVIFNGFTGNVNNNLDAPEQSATLNLIYSGEIYAKQDYKSLIEAVKLVVKKYGADSILLTFLGTANSNHKIPYAIYEGYTESVKVTNRLPHAEALAVQAGCDAFVMLSHTGLKGIASSKIFDYLKNVKPIILFRNDFDVLEHLTVSANLGIIANSTEELFNKLEKLIEIKKAGRKITAEPNINFIQQFSRENQAKTFLTIIKSHVK
jgi:glycosyltransferase involved in cell wall biosynthesis